jgi:hypothetical protein
VDAAEPDHDQRAEQRVVHDARDELDRGCDHRLDKHRRIRAESCLDGPVRGTDGLGVGQAEADRTDVALVHQCRVGGLERHREAEPLRRVDRGGSLAYHGAGEHRNPVATRHGSGDVRRLPPAAGGQRPGHDRPRAGEVHIGQFRYAPERRLAPGGVPGGVCQSGDRLLG